MKALVTGASGFIGLHLCRYLQQIGWDVVAVVRPTSQTEGLRNLGVEVCVAELQDPDSLQQVVQRADHVFHLAGLTKALTRDALFQANEKGVRNLLDACAMRQTPPSITLVSSLAAAGPWHGRPRIESDPLEPVSNYGHSKRAGETVAESFAAEIPITVVRPPIVFGQGDRSTFAMFSAIYWTWTHTIPGIIPQKFSLIHIEDLVRFLVDGFSAEKLTRGSHHTGQGYYFVDSGEYLSYGQIGALIGHGLGRPITFPVPIPRPLVWVIGGVAELGGQVRKVQGPLNLDKAREATAGSWWCSSAKANAHFGFQVTVPLEQRFRQTADWYREQGWLGLRALKPAI
jgi:dihydroflavonol-4-reductase